MSRHPNQEWNPVSSKKARIHGARGQRFFKRNTSETRPRTSLEWPNFHSTPFSAGDRAGRAGLYSPTPPSVGFFRNIASSFARASAARSVAPGAAPRNGSRL